MASLLGFLLLALAITWIVLERRRRAQMRLLEMMIEELAQGREPGSYLLERGFSRLGQRVEEVAVELEHVRRQRQLAEANLQIILSSMQEGAMVVDSRRAVRLANPCLRKMFSLPHHVFGQSVLEAVRDSSVDEMIAEALETGQPREQEFDLSGHWPLITLMVTVSPMRDAAGEAGALAMFRDVTRLNQLEKVRREFVANVSHELRTPLSIFQGYVENLVDCPEMASEDRASVYAVLEKHSHRLNALVEDLLILARLEAKQDELEKEPLDVRAFLSEIARDWTARMAKKGVALKLNLASDLPRLEGDRLRLEQVFTNLLDNALKYTPREHSVTLGAAARGEEVELWVKDTGQGILSSALPHIFERFYRADKARSRELGGTGLGLSIVKHIAQAHGGSVEAESAFGKGTTIRVKLPVLQAAA